MQRLMIVTGFLILLTCPSVQAELNFCNGAPLTIETVLGEPTAGNWQSRGWWTLKSGECANVLGGDLTNRYYYAFAQTPGGKWKWRGEIPFCLGYPGPFALQQSDCSPDMLQNFSTVDTRESKSFYYWFTCPECLDSRLVNAIRLNVRWLEGLANQAAPLSYRTNDWQDIGPADIQYGVRRSPFSITVNGNQVSISARVAYWLSVSHTRLFGIRTGLASCGVDEPEPTADVKLTIIFGITENGKLTSKTRTELSFASRCNLTVFNIDATGYVQEVAQPQLDRAASLIDSRIGEIDVSRVLKVKDLY
jgi:uncharacterized membrane protein